MSFTTQKAGDVIVGQQVIHLECTQATSIYHSPTKEIDWKELKIGVKKQQKYEKNHIDGKCIQCPMSKQFGVHKFCSDLIKYGKLPIIKSLKKSNKKVINTNNSNTNNNTINDDNKQDKE